MSDSNSETVKTVYRILYPSHGNFYSEIKEIETVHEDDNSYFIKTTDGNYLPRENKVYICFDTRKEAAQALHLLAEKRMLDLKKQYKEAVTINDKMKLQFDQCDE